MTFWWRLALSRAVRFQKSKSTEIETSGNQDMKRKGFFAMDHEKFQIT